MKQLTSFWKKSFILSVLIINLIREGICQCGESITISAWKKYCVPINGGFFDCNLNGTYISDGESSITLCNIGAIFTIQNFGIEDNNEISMNITGLSIQILNSSLTLGSSHNLSLNALNGTVEIQNSNFNQVHVLSISSASWGNFQLSSGYEKYGVIISNSHLQTTLYTSIISRFYVWIFDSNIFSILRRCKANCSCTQSSNTNCYSIVNSVGPYINLNNMYGNNSQIFTQYKSVQTFIQKMQQNFTLLIVSGSDILLQSTNMKAGNIGIYSIQNIDILSESSITTDGMGCLPSLGAGCGFIDSIIGLSGICGGTGGSYGGQGQNSYSISSETPYGQVNSICELVQSRPIYGNLYYPMLEGSGGGGQGPKGEVSDLKFGSAGGGTIFLQIGQTINLVNSTISSNGWKPEMNSEQSGGGSGGSIYLSQSQLYGNGVIRANGGNSGLNGGAGGGGRIFFNFSNWSEPQSYVSSLNSSITVEAFGGINNNSVNATAGSIASTPCFSGYYVSNYYLCQKCAIGTYKLQIDLNPCNPCVNAPKNAEYIYSNGTSPRCQISCKNGHTQQNKYNECLSTWESFKSQIGGNNGLMIIFFLLGVVLVVGWIRISSRRKNKEQLASQTLQQMFPNLTVYPDNNIEIEKGQNIPSEFVSEDLPYHYKRIYLHGENQISQPWRILVQRGSASSLIELFEVDRISDNDSNSSNIQLKPNAIINKKQTQIDPNEFNRALSQFNEKAKFSQSNKIILQFTKIFYFAAYYLIFKRMKAKKFKSLTQTIAMLQSAIYNDEQNIFIKFSSSPDFTLAFFDIVDYSTSLLQWENEANFPIALLLAGQGSFINPFNINYDDPLCKSISFTFSKNFRNSFDSDEKEEGFTQNLSEFRNFLDAFNMNAQTIDFSNTVSVFTTNIQNLLKQVHSYNQDFFIDLGIYVNLCIHQMADSDQNSDLQSSIVILYYHKDSRELDSICREIHFLKNYSNCYEIQFSIQFSKFSQNQIFDDQVEIICPNDINQQLQIFKKKNFEQDKENIAAIKMKYFKKLDESKDFDIKQELIPQHKLYWSNQAFDEEQQCKSCQVVWHYILRGGNFVKSLLLTYRVQNIQTSVLICILLILLVMDWILLLLELIFLALDAKCELYLNSNLFIAEMVSELGVFPLSFIVSPILMTYWLFQHNYELGKIFMLFNFMAIFTQLIIFSYGFAWIGENSVNQQNDTNICETPMINYSEICKLLALVVQISLSYFGSIYLPQSEDLK